MKKLVLLTMAIAFLAIGCKSDDDATTFELRYDGNNSTAPLLDSDVYEAAVRFPASLTSPYKDLKLRDVDFYILDEPSVCRVIVYDAGNSSSPGAELYNSGDISVNGGSWNTHTLSSPLTLSGEDMWISVEFTHTGSSRTVGCDTGPAASNADWIRAASTSQWQTLRDFTSAIATVDINWNIRGILVEE